jgi:hypothetical protein
MLKSYLKSKDIVFEEKRADENQAYAQELYEQSGQLGVPFSIVKTDDGNEVKILGFDRPKFDEVLQLR